MMFECLFLLYSMTTQTQMKGLSTTRVDESIAQDDILLTEAILKAKAVYGEDITLVLVTPINTDEELAFRPDMAQFIPDTTKQIMKISVLSALKDTFNAHHVMAVDGTPRSHREPAAKTMYFITDGRILAVDPTQESLDIFL